MQSFAVIAVYLYHDNIFKKRTWQQLIIVVHVSLDDIVNYINRAWNIGARNAGCENKGTRRVVITNYEQKKKKITTLTAGFSFTVIIREAWNGTKKVKRLRREYSLSNHSFSSATSTSFLLFETRFSILKMHIRLSF